MEAMVSGDLIHRGAFSSPGVYAWVRNRSSYQSPINGAFETNRSLFPGVNAWATEKSFQIEALPGSVML